MDVKVLASGTFAVICALIAAVYREPKAYSELIKPLLKWVAWAGFFIGVGVWLGHVFARSAVLAVAPTENVKVLSAIAESSNSGYLFTFGATGLWLLDIGLMILAEKSAKWKARPEGT